MESKSWSAASCTPRPMGRTVLVLCTGCHSRLKKRQAAVLFVSCILPTTGILPHADLWLNKVWTIKSKWTNSCKRKSALSSLEEGSTQVTSDISGLWHFKSEATELGRKWRKESNSKTRVTVSWSQSKAVSVLLGRKKRWRLSWYNRNHFCVTHSKRLKFLFPEFTSLCEC